AGHLRPSRPRVSPKFNAGPPTAVPTSPPQRRRKSPAGGRGSRLGRLRLGRLLELTTLGPSTLCPSILAPSMPDLFNLWVFKTRAVEARTDDPRQGIELMERRRRGQGPFKRGGARTPGIGGRTRRRRANSERSADRAAAVPSASRSTARRR